MAGPREVFARIRENWLANVSTLRGDELAEDVVIETPFAPPGRPGRTVGREAVSALFEAGRAGFPVRFEHCRTIAIHDTTDPEVIVVEYELGGVVTTTGHRASAPFIAVLRVRDGQVAHWREYQNVPAIARALAGTEESGGWTGNSAPSGAGRSVPT
jgi:uncharacterized protein